MTGEIILRSATLMSQEAVKTEVSSAAGLEGLVREHSRLVFRIAYSVLRDHHNAEDALQDVFLRALKYQRDWQSLENPAAWLSRVAWRVAVDKSKSRGHKVQLEDTGAQVELLASGGKNVEELAASGQMQRLMQAMIGSLPSELREPLLLSTVEELGAAEIAGILGIAEPTVRTRTLRARRLLKEKLEKVLGKPHA
jgi:RNA polymerase sigma-70 factor (ECF subfamily)